MDSLDYLNIEEIINQLSDEERQTLAQSLQVEYENLDEDTTDETEWPLPPELESRIADKVIRTIRREDFGAEVIRLSTVGFMKTFLALINPAFAHSSDKKK